MSKDAKAPVPQKPIRTVSKALDLKDVKQPVLLPSRLSGTAAAPKPSGSVPKSAPDSPYVRVTPSGTQVLDELVDTRIDTDACLSPPSSPRPTTDGKPCPGTDECCSPDPGRDQSALAKFYESRLDAIYRELDDRRQVLERAYLKSHGERGSLSDWKHYYLNVQVSPAFVNPGQQNYYQLCTPAVGSAVNNRITNKIAMHSTRIRGIISVVSTGLFTLSPIFPQIKIFVIRDKMPVTPGILPNLIATDSNPPSAQFTLLSRLGNAQGVQNDRTAVINPIAYDRYHIYKIHNVDVQKMRDTMEVPNPAVYNSGTVNNATYEFDWDIPFHMLGVPFINSGSLNPVMNSVYIALTCDYAGPVLDAANGFTLDYRITCDTKFRDIQD